MGRVAILTARYWVDDVPRPAWQQMAIDRAMAAQAEHGDCIYRLYRWTESSISFGANEAAYRSWDRAAIARAQVPCVRRPTGGRGVWHDADDLTYAVGATLTAPGGLRLAYRVIHEQLARALARVTAPISLAPPRGRPTLGPGACFDLAVGGEVLIGDRKAIGSAQAIFGTTLLQHGAIALADRRLQLARFALEQGDSAALTASGGKPAAFDGAAVSGAIVSEWHNAGMQPIGRDAIGRIEEIACQFAPRFQDADWTWRR